MDAIAKPCKIVGTIGLPRKPPAPTAPEPEAKPKTTRAPIPARAKKSAPDKQLPGAVDLAVDLAPEHRHGPRKVGGAARMEFVLKLMEAARGAPLEPTDTRQLRLALAMAEAFPTHTPAYLTWVLRDFIDANPEHELTQAARELRAAIFGATNHAKLARFAPMLRGALEVVERRAAPKEMEETKTAN
ncbi:MAG: hypothetical protein WA733_25555 [Methylocystis sp.]